MLLDVALLRLPVTFVLDRAGITGEDGPSHHGIWDLALLGMVPGLRLAAPRDEATLRAALRESVDWTDGPTVVRFPKTPMGGELPALRTVDGVDVLTEPDSSAPVDVLLIAIGALAADVLEAADAVRRAGYSVRVVDPRWVAPVPAVLLDLGRQAGLVVTVEDGLAVGGVGARIAQGLRAAGIDVATREIGVPTEFLAHGRVPDVRAAIGLTGQDIGRRVVEWSATVVAPWPDAEADVERDRGVEAADVHKAASPQRIDGGRD